VQNWSNLYKKNAGLNNESQLPGFDPRKNSNSFFIAIKNVRGIPHSEPNNAGTGFNNAMAAAKYFLEYYVTLYNKDLGEFGGFYGRTYRSKPYPLIREAADTWMLDKEDIIYFHTNYTEKTSFMVIECVIVRDIAGVKSYSSGGYALCDIFQNLNGQSEEVRLYKGSPRNIGVLGIEAAMRSSQ